MTQLAEQTRGRPREFDMDAALDAALTVFSERGYHATAIGDLTEAMGLTVGSIYKAFKDKRGVFIAVLDYYSAKRAALSDQWVARARTGRDKISAILQFYGSSSHGDIGRRGCLTIGTAKELALFDAEIAERVESSFATKQTQLERLIALGQSDGSIRPDLDAPAVARTLLGLMLGMRVLGKTSPSEAEMAAVASIGLKLLD